jgi:hypothetical protein
VSGGALRGTSTGPLMKTPPVQGHDQEVKHEQ